jgi:hypothetical protein
VGQRTFFEACALQGSVRELHGAFFEFRKGGDADRLLAELAVFRPHAVIVFRPEVIPPGCFHSLRAATLGWLTEPIPRGTTEAHPDQRRRLWELSQVDASNFDRIVSFDPLIAETASGIVDVWRSLPLPCADRFFRPVQPLRGRPRALFVGRSTPHREYFLTPVKHHYDLLHMAFGVDADELHRLFGEHEVGINLHNEPYPSFENRVCLHLAAGHLVISETLSPTHGLEPGIDYVEFSEPDELLATLRVATRDPEAYRRVRVRGRRKAESYRAGVVWPRLVADCFADLAAFGTTRRAA